MRGWRVAAVLDVANNNNNQREFLALDVREKLQRKEDGARSIPYIVGWEVRKVVYLKYLAMYYKYGLCSINVQVSKVKIFYVQEVFI